MLLFVALSIVYFAASLWIVWRVASKDPPEPGAGPRPSDQQRRSARDAVVNAMRALKGRPSW